MPEEAEKKSRRRRGRSSAHESKISKPGESAPPAGSKVADAPKSSAAQQQSTTGGGDKATPGTDEVKRRRAAERRFSQYQQPIPDLDVLRKRSQQDKKKGGQVKERRQSSWSRILLAFRGKKSMHAEHDLYRSVKTNVMYTVCLNMMVLACCVMTTELETNEWYLKDGEIMAKWEPYILLLKCSAIVLSLVAITINFRYHAQKLSLAMIRMNVSEGARVSIWQVPRVARHLFSETLALLVTQVPYWNGEMTISMGLSRHDPRASYRYDVFIFIAMLCLRSKFIYRFIYVYSDLFSVDAVTLSNITGTPVTPRLGVRNFIASKPATVTVVVFLTYLCTMAYIHNKLEGVTNYWHQDRFCIDDDDASEKCLTIYESEHPVTYLNSMWIHFVAASTIGYGEYLVQTPIGRLLVSISFIVGLLISSFVVAVLFDALSISSSEQYIIDKMRLKRTSVALVDKTAVLLQKLVRNFLLRRELRMLKSNSPQEHRSFTSSLGTTVVGRRREESTPARRMRVEKCLRQQTQQLNVAMFVWRAARREYKESEQNAVDKDATITDLDSRCEAMEDHLICVRKEMDTVKSSLKEIQTLVENQVYPVMDDEHMMYYEYQGMNGDGHWHQADEEWSPTEEPATSQVFSDHGTSDYHGQPNGKAQDWHMTGHGAHSNSVHHEKHVGEGETQAASQPHAQPPGSNAEAYHSYQHAFHRKAPDEHHPAGSAGGPGALHGDWGAESQYQDPAGNWAGDHHAGNVVDKLHRQPEQHQGADQETHGMHHHSQQAQQEEPQEYDIFPEHDGGTYAMKNPMLQQHQQPGSKRDGGTSSARES